MYKLSIKALKGFLIVLIPIVIILGAVRLVATRPYLSFEYSKPDFPEDFLGFDGTQRLTHAADNLKYVTEDQSLENLAGQKHEDTQLYNERELKHMQDVQNIYRIVWQVWQAAWVLAVLCVLALGWRKENRQIVAAALRAGGALTIGLVVVIGLTAIIAWQIWFVAFHQLFFQAGSWTFDFSNTLIRLFPEKFWYDAVLTISSLSVISGSLVFWMGSYLLKNGDKKYDQTERGQAQYHTASRS
jgi:integral membrane protein (TIGR01906 family)